MKPIRNGKDECENDRLREEQKSGHPSNTKKEGKSYYSDKSLPDFANKYKFSVSYHKLTIEMNLPNSFKIPWGFQIAVQFTRRRYPNY